MEPATDAGSDSSSTYRCVVEDDISAGHVAMEDVLLQVLDQRTLHGGKKRRGDEQ